MIAGPTASGKSALAVARAEAEGGVIINTDAMQVYDGLQVLTARPEAEDLVLADHRLYGVIDAAVAFSTGQWLTAVGAVLGAVPHGAPVFFVGGTGLYFDALINGFADVPAVPDEVVAVVAAEIAGLDAVGRGRLLAGRDPAMAARLQAPDPQRVIRALSVLAATGRSLASFQDAGQAGLLGAFDVERLVLAPERAVLRQRIGERFATMFETGAVEEVEALLGRGLDPRWPAMKAIGVPQIADWLRGATTRERALELAITATRQYAKRQETWFRNRMGDWPRLDPLVSGG
ncbi:MAG: tRNA dimethylallyltransferase [Devosia sp.]|nr:tRNA dimethylallyltransferase [Devosia sp.]